MTADIFQSSLDIFNLQRDYSFESLVNEDCFVSQCIFRDAFTELNTRCRVIPLDFNIIE